MSSATKQAKIVDKRKDHPNKANQQEEKRRIAKNAALLNQFAQKRD
ncbi:MAG: hypothetical protein HQK56_18255, partial [Deltaproteobacteria bacterium]|nr:hypothetical protein [Deltaproteobacteria bacterium]